jgi:hypothetical protein
MGGTLKLPKSLNQVSYFGFGHLGNIHLITTQFELHTIVPHWFAYPTKNKTPFSVSYS